MHMYYKFMHTQRCHREHSKFPENLLRGSRSDRGGGGGRGCPPSHARCGAFLFFNVELCVLVHTSEGIFTYFYTLFLCLIEYWVLIVIYCTKKKKEKKKLPSFWKFPEIRKFPEMWHLCILQYFQLLSIAYLLLWKILTSNWTDLMNTAFLSSTNFQVPWVRWLCTWSKFWFSTCNQNNKIQYYNNTQMSHFIILAATLGPPPPNCYIVWLSLIWDTDWLNTVTWSTNISVCCPPQSCGGGTLIDTTHFFTQTNGKLSLRYYRFKHVCWPS